MNIESVLQKIFYSQDRNEPNRNPNDPADNAYFNAMRGIQNQALVTWLTENGGERLLGDMERSIISKMQALVVADVKDISGIIAMIKEQQNIFDELRFYDRIQSAFAETEKRKKEIAEGK